MALVAEPRREPQADDQLQRVIDDGKRLLAYALEAGVDVDADTAQKIITAGESDIESMRGPDVGALAESVAKLAAKVRPVTVETLRFSEKDAHKVIRRYIILSVTLGLSLIVLSVLSGVLAGLSGSIKN
jgi:hypothetical protein